MLSMITTNETEITINSVDFLNEYINPARNRNGQGKVAYKDFIARVIDETEKSHEEIFLMDSTGGRKRHVVNLSYDEMILVGMRESKAVRKSVLSKLKELSRPKEDPVLLLARRVLEQDAEIKALEKSKSQINDKRTATLMNKASQDAKKIKRLEGKLQDVGEYQSLIAAGLPQRTETDVNPKAQTWRILMKICEQLGFPPKKVKDPRYGEVNTYHVAVITKYKEDYLF